MAALSQRGHEAYIVGGCVRDSLLNTIPGDWDIATSATPDTVLSLLGGEATGLRYGTVTVPAGTSDVQVTTYRREGPYKDHRRPDYVEFVTDLKTDLARRDFTVNAMAAGMDGGVTDPFGGRGDLKNKLIRCVGDPDGRFYEDALRILRALRFASVLDFHIEDQTRDALLKHADTLRFLTKKKKSEEIGKLRRGAGAERVVAEYGEAMLKAGVPLSGNTP
jgi:tRNA nucleotidyltransferase (CCA-adding enzyme)